MWRVAHQQDRPLAPTHHILSDTAQHRANRSAPAMGAHDNQVGVDVVSGRDDRGTGLSDGSTSLGNNSNPPQPRGNSVGMGFRRLAAQRRGVHQDDSSVARACQRHGQGQRKCAFRRAVKWDQHGLQLLARALRRGAAETTGALLARAT